MTNRKENYCVSVMTRESGDSPHETVHQYDPIVSDEARLVLERIFYSILSLPIGVAGSVANAINIVVFVKQGFRYSVDVSLCALAVSDFGFLLSLIISSIWSNPLIQFSDNGVDVEAIYKIIGGLFMSSFVRLTNLITAFITFERCVCVALPLKVKHAITPKRTILSLLVIYVILFATYLPLIPFAYVAPSFSAKRNATLIQLMFTSQSSPTLSYSLNVVTQICSFICAIICTAILVLKLLFKSQWRQKSMSMSSGSESISTRDRKIVKMVTLLSAMFIVCYLPSVVNLIMISLFSPEYSLSGLYANSLSVSWAIIDTIDGINSSVSILIYYHMSSKFRKTFKGFVCITTNSHSRI